MRMIKLVFNAVVLLVLAMNVALASVNNEQDDTRVGFTKALMGKNNQQKQAAVVWLVQSHSAELAKPILSAWLEGNLYYLNDKTSNQNQSLFIIQDIKKQKFAVDAWDDSTLAITNPRQFKKIRVNNILRRAIRSELALLGLNSSDPNVRAEAVTALLGNTDDAMVNNLRARQAIETDSKVKALLDLAVAIDTALDPAGNERTEAIELIADHKLPVVLTTLNTVISSESEPQVVAAAQKGLAQYQQSQKFYAGVETLFFGLSLGSVLVLAGIGLAITFGVMGVINMAHGELIMIGAYTTYVMQQLMPTQIGLALLLSIPMAFIVSGLVGIVIERSVICHLYGRPLETLLATFGISLILQQAVRSIFSPLNRSVSTPEWMSGALEINPMLSLTYNRLYIVLFCAAVFIGLVMILKKTPLGLQVRAVSQNRSMARAMGIRSERVDALTFGLGSGVAGVAGVALSQLTNVGPNMGQAYIIDSFMVVVFGGVGNLWGTLVAGLSLGLFNKILEPWAGAVLAKIFVLVFIILFIQKRPRGLFPQRGRAAEG